MPSYYKKKISLSGDFRPSVIFLAEGDSEGYFINSVLNRLPASNASIFLLEGKSNIREKLINIAKEPNFEHVNSIGVMLDGDNTPDAILTSALDALRAISFPSDRQAINQHNLIIGDGKKSGIFLSPGRGEKGTVENLVLREISEKREWNCLDSLAACIQERTTQRIGDKALVQTYISIRRGNLCGLGRAFEAGIFDVAHSAYLSAFQFIEAVIQ